MPDSDRKTVFAYIARFDTGSDKCLVGRRARDLFNQVFEEANVWPVPAALEASARDTCHQPGSPDTLSVPRIKRREVEICPASGHTYTASSCGRCGRCAAASSRRSGDRAQRRPGECLREASGRGGAGELIETGRACSVFAAVRFNALIDVPKASYLSTRTYAGVSVRRALGNSACACMSM
jgi:hypothetical protein